MSTVNSPTEVKIKIDPDTASGEPSSKNDVIQSEGTKSPEPVPNADVIPYIVQPATGGAQLRIPPKVKLVPEPWGKIKHLIIASYLSFLCCCITAAYANQYAMDAKRMKDIGLRGEAKVLARQSARCIYASIILGVIIILGLGIPIMVVYIKNNT